MANTSILAAFERMWQHVIAVVSSKADVTHEHDIEDVTNLRATLDGKADSEHEHEISDIANLQSSLDGKVPTSRTINGKILAEDITLSASDVGASESGHNHDDRYYTETEIDTAFVNVAYMNATDNENIVETDELTALVNRVNELENKAVTTVPQTFTEEQKTQARGNIGAAPKSYILHGTIDYNNNVTLTNFNWDEFDAIANSNEDIHIAARLTTEDGYLYEYAFSEYWSEESTIVFSIQSEGYMKNMYIYGNGNAALYDKGHYEPLTFHYEDGTTRTIEVYVK